MIQQCGLLALCSVPPVGQTKAATCLANTTSVAEIFQRTQAQYAAMFKRRAFREFCLHTPFPT
jgi:tubulin beta